MKKTVLTFGLIAGGILSIMMVATIPFLDGIGFEKGEVIGYTSMVVAFLLVFFGIRSYRDNVRGGIVSFGRAVAVGLLITSIASVCYVATWEVLYFNVLPDFGTKYVAYQVDRARASGKSEAELAKLRAEQEKNLEYYNNPAINAAITFLEPTPVGLVVTLISAAILRRKRKRSDAVLATT